MPYTGYSGEWGVDTDPSSDTSYNYLAVYVEDSMGSPCAPYVGHIALPTGVLGPGVGMVVVTIPDPYGDPPVPPVPPLRSVPPRPKRWIREAV